MKMYWLFFCCLPVVVMGQTHLANWQYSPGLLSEQLLVTKPHNFADAEEITLPHRILLPNQSLWYQTKVMLARATWLYVNADDGAQVFLNQAQQPVQNGEFFLLPSTKDSAVLTIRVLNNAMMGGLRDAVLYEKQPFPDGRFCDKVPVEPWIVQNNDRYLIRIASDEASSTLHYQYEGLSKMEAQPVATEQGVHLFELPFLADKKLQYQIQADHGSSAQYEIQPPVSDKPLRIGFWGDSQGGWDTFARVCQQLHAMSPDFTIGLGDITANGRDSCQWLDMLAAMGPLKAWVPTWFVPGNHDYDGYYDDLRPDNYNHYIQTDNYFAWNVANAAFIALDPNANFPIGIDKAQRKWLNRQLKSSAWKRAKWRFILLHQPPYSQGWPGYEGDAFIRNWVDANAARHGIDFVLSGHSHCYERLTRQYQGQQTHFVVSGGAGGGLEPLENNPRPTMDKVIKAHHFGWMEVSGNQVIVTIYSPDGRVLDTWTTNK